jgi:hypothetical protein
VIGAVRSALCDLRDSISATRSARCVDALAERPAALVARLRARKMAR